jgi:hypothetical protein
MEQIGIFLEESSMSMNSLAPETIHIMALKIKDYIIFSPSLFTVGLACQVELPIAGGYA